MIDSFYKTLIYDDRYKYILEGLKNTLVIAFFAILIGIILGILISLVKNRYKENGKGKILNGIVKKVDINIVIVGIISFGLNSAAYVSEIIRAGIDSVDIGQKEAARSLGLSYKQEMFNIVLPQAIKNVLPALGNEFITLLKETSVAGYIGITELIKASDIIASNTFDYFFPLIIVAIIYLILTLGLSKLLGVFERKFKNEKVIRN